MPKMKTNRGAAKRLKVSGRGKIKRRRAGKSHILGFKRRKRKRRLRHTTTVDATCHSSMKRLIPYK